MHHVGDLDKCDDRPFNHVLQRAVGPNAQSVGLALGGQHINLFGNQRVEHRLHVWHQGVVVRQIHDNMAHRPTNVIGNEVDDLGGSRGKTHNAQTVVQKNSANVGARQQVVHVVVGA